MSVFPSFLSSSRRSIRFCGPVIVAVVLLTAGSSFKAMAQSGRRAPVRPSAGPVPSTLATETPKSEPANSSGDESHPKVTLLFARQLTSKHFANEDVIAASFFKRLAAYVNLDCVSIGDIKQSQAQARAKSEKDAIVVLLKFDINSYQSGTIILNSPDLEVEYFAFAPRTGKKHAKGKVYFQTIGGGRMQKSGWPNGTPIRITPEAAGMEAAETLYHLLSIKTAINQRP